MVKTVTIQAVHEFLCLVITDVADDGLLLLLMTGMKILLLMMMGMEQEVMSNQDFALIGISMYNLCLMKGNLSNTIECHPNPLSSCSTGLVFN